MKNTLKSLKAIELNLGLVTLVFETQNNENTNAGMLGKGNK